MDKKKARRELAGYIVRTHGMTPRDAAEAAAAMLKENYDLREDE